MAKFSFTAIVSNNHLFKLLAMITTLKKHCDDFNLYVLCANKEAYKILRKINFSGVWLFKLEDIEDDQLLAAKKDRIFHAYCWTLKPAFLCFIMNKFKDTEYYVHLDSDLCFFSDPKIIFEEDADASILLTHHRNSQRFEHFYDISGIYNTGFVGFKNNSAGRNAAKYWREKCLENCPIKEDIENKIFGDQRYAEHFEDMFGGTHVVNNIGANAALWNITDYAVAKKDNGVTLNSVPLVFYHFSGFTIISPNQFNICWYYYIEDNNTVEYIYMPYIKLLQNAMSGVERYFPWFKEGFMEKKHTPDTHFINCQRS